MRSSTLTRQALDLPLADRLDMAQALWASIDGQFADTSAGDAILVARERDAEFDAGEVDGKSHDEVLRAARHRLG